MAVTLRPYQKDLVAKVRDAFRTNRRVLVVSPTGSGKTVLFAYVTLNASVKGNTVTILAHRSEILDQISIALDTMGVPHGRIQPGHDITDDPVTIGMVQTVGRRIEKIPKPSLLVVDEAHHAITGTYSNIMDAWPDVKILGVTATPKRLDGKGLHRAFDVLILGPEMADLIAGGYLASYKYLAPPSVVDLSTVVKRMGDYQIDQLAEAMDKRKITGDAIGHYRTYLDGRPAIAFCVTVAHAEHVAEQFRESGYNAASVDGSMGKEARALRMAGIGNGELNILTSCELISEGVDVPVVSGAVLLRPTESLGLYLQQVGRCLRPKPDRSQAIILDHVNNVKHGMPDAIRKWTLADTKIQADPTARCEVCYRVFNSYPKWRDDQTCEENPQPDECILLELPQERGPKSGPDHVNGDLTILDAKPAWADGINIATARGPDYAELLKLADTEEKLRQIARLRSYKRGWVSYVLKSRPA